MSKIEKLKKRLAEIEDFRNISTIMQTETRAYFSLIDHDGQSYIILKHGADTFTISIAGAKTTINGFDDTKIFYIRNNKLLIFIPIDGAGGLLDATFSRCDCVFFDENDFCFVEFKLNATSVDKSAIKRNRKKAIDQLSNTIDFFDDKLQRNYEGLNVESYIATPQHYPRDDASWKALSVAFLENYGVQIYETREKICK